MTGKHGLFQDRSVVLVSPHEDFGHATYLLCPIKGVEDISQGGANAYALLNEVVDTLADIHIGHQHPGRCHRSGSELAYQRRDDYLDRERQVP